VATTVTIKGLKQLERKLGRIPAHMQRAAIKAVKDEVGETAEDERRLAPKRTGELADSVQEEITSGGLGGRVWPRARYARFVNDGARGVAAQPFATAAGKLTRRRFKKRTEKLVDAALRRLAKG
jgi:HK97 gp10 family phage protein